MKKFLVSYIFAGIYDEVKNNPKGHTRTKTPDWNEFCIIKLQQIKNCIKQRIWTTLALFVIVNSGIWMFFKISQDVTFTKLFACLGIIAWVLSLIGFVCLVGLYDSVNKEIDSRRQI